MIQLIGKVIGIWQGADGALAEMIYDRGDGHSGDWDAVDALMKPIKKVSMLCELLDGQRIVQSFDEIAGMLTDRTGVLVVFRERGEANIGSQFSKPNNAAIFNANGDLRFQLINPWGEGAVFRREEWIYKPNGDWELGVRICPGPGLPCDEVIVVDGSTADLSKQRRLWMRE